MSEDIAPKILFTVHSHFLAPFLLFDHNSKFAAFEDEYAPDRLPAQGVVEEVEQAQGEGEQEGMTPAPDSAPPPYLQITMDKTHKPRNDRAGFVFGSNRSTCDILLDDSSGEGISNMHFSISVSPTSHSLILKNISRNQTKLRSKSLGKTLVTQQRALLQNESVYIRFPAFEIEIRVPDHGDHWARYVENLAVFCRKTVSSIPDLKNLDVHSVSTTASGASLYSLHQRVGSGAYGDVYRAIHIMNGQVFAAKQLTKPRHVRLEEVMLLREMEHDNIVKFVSFVVDVRQHPVLVMEFIDGPDLQVAFRSRHPEPLEVRLVLRQLFNAVQYMHTRSIVHRDIKPSNIMVWSHDPIHVKLTDFGLAAKADERGLCRGRCGTPLYAAPEVISNEPYGKYADIWSLGVVALEYSYGLPHFPENLRSWSQCKTWPSRVREQVECEKLDSSDSTANFISTLLTLDPARRSSAEQSLAHSFFTLTARKASTALPGPKCDTSLDDTVTRAAASEARRQTAELVDTEIPRVLLPEVPLSTQVSVLSDRHTAKWKRESGVESDDETNAILRELETRGSVMLGSGQELIREEESAATSAPGTSSSGTSTPGKRTIGAIPKASRTASYAAEILDGEEDSSHIAPVRSAAPTPESITQRCVGQ